MRLEIRDGQELVFAWDGTDVLIRDDLDELARTSALCREAHEYLEKIIVTIRKRDSASKGSAMRGPTPESQRCPYDPGRRSPHQDVERPG